MSSNEVAIAARGIAKAYIIRHLDGQRVSPLRAVARRLRDPIYGMARETIWALRDISFDIRQGEVVGLVGRNGAGKSTLLKLLSHVTEPTRGEIGIWGRVGSLLEVGTGFHPELTGRENVFLNGSILGMRRSEIKAQFDAIAAFSGVETFLDTPVKRYSSGMRVRLAFAVAVHLKPEILIIDEVLAVGDGEFQRRCLAKMDELARSGRTILLVSHNMGSIQALCPRAMHLKKGRLVGDGPAGEIVSQYLQDLQTTGGAVEDDPEERVGSGLARVRSIRLMSEADQDLNVVMGGEDIILEMEYESRYPGRPLSVMLNIYNESGVAVAAAHTQLTHPEMPPLSRRGRLRCRMRRLPLTTGSYRVAVALQVGGETADYLPRAATLEVVASVFYPTGTALDSKKAAFHLDHDWEHLTEDAALEVERG
jgi:lipopolysaccharide transport system ATP-binding protein